MRWAWITLGLHTRSPPPSHTLHLTHAPSHTLLTPKDIHNDDDDADDRAEAAAIQKLLASANSTTVQQAQQSLSSAVGAWKGDDIFDDDWTTIAALASAGRLNVSVGNVSSTVQSLINATSGGNPRAQALYANLTTVLEQQLAAAKRYEILCCVAVGHVVLDPKGVGLHGNTQRQMVFNINNNGIYSGGRNVRINFDDLDDDVEDDLLEIVKGVHLCSGGLLRWGYEATCVA